jgi:hypothetical protein
MQGRLTVGVQGMGVQVGHQPAPTWLGWQRRAGRRRGRGGGGDERGGAYVALFATFELTVLRDPVQAPDVRGIRLKLDRAGTPRVAASRPIRKPSGHHRPAAKPAGPTHPGYAPPACTGEGRGSAVTDARMLFS